MNERKDKLITKITILAISLMFISGAAIGGAIPKMRDYYDLTQTQTELLMTSMNAVKIIAIFISIFIVKKIGLKRTILLGLLLVGLSGILPLLITDYIAVLGSRLLLGIGLGMYNAPAIRYVSLLYKGQTRATLLGFRTSVEGVGQAILTVIGGGLISIHWNLGFIVYLVAIPLALAFYWIVPSIKEDQKIEEKEIDEKMPIKIYVLAVIAMFMIANWAAIGMRFPSIATEIKGVGFNSSHLLAIFPLVGVLSGLTFGFLNKKLGNALFYFGILTLVLGNFLIYFSSGNLTILFLGAFIATICPFWCLPFIFEKISKLPTMKNQKIATTMVLIGMNMGTFLSPLLMEVIHRFLDNDYLEAPFLIFGSFFSLMLIQGMQPFYRIQKSNKVNL